MSLRSDSGREPEGSASRSRERSSAGETHARSSALNGRTSMFRESISTQSTPEVARCCFSTPEAALVVFSRA